MFPQGLPHGPQRFDAHPRALLGRLRADLAHDCIDVFEFFQRGPALVTSPPVGTGLEPDGKRLGEVLGRMALRVPSLQVMDVTFAEWSRRVELRVRLRWRAEDAPPGDAPPQPIRVVDRVADLVPQNPQARLVGAPFDFQHLRLLQLHQPRMREVKRNRHSRNAVGTEPVGRQPEVRAEPHPLELQFVVHPLDAFLQRCAVDADRQIGEPEFEELGVGHPRERTVAVARPGVAPVALGAGVRGSRAGDHWKECDGGSANSTKSVNGVKSQAGREC